MECYSMQETIKLKKHNETEKMFTDGCIIFDDFSKGYDIK